MPRYAGGGAAAGRVGGARGGGVARGRLAVRRSEGRPRQATSIPLDLGTDRRTRRRETGHTLCISGRPRSAQTFSMRERAWKSCERAGAIEPSVSQVKGSSSLSKKHDLDIACRFQNPNHLPICATISHRTATVQLGF